MDSFRASFSPSQRKPTSYRKKDRGARIKLEKKRQRREEAELEERGGNSRAQEKGLQGTLATQGENEHPRDVEQLLRAQLQAKTAVLSPGESPQLEWIEHGDVSTLFRISDCKTKASRYCMAF